LDAAWDISNDSGAYDLEVFGPNGYRWLIAGRVPAANEVIANPEIVLRHRGAEYAIELTAANRGRRTCVIATAPTMYRSDRATTLELTPAAERISIAWPVSNSGFWYDFNVVAPMLPGWLRRFAGRVETGRHGISDPALGRADPPC
jgi:phospholipase C